MSVLFPFFAGVALAMSPEAVSPAAPSAAPSAAQPRASIERSIAIWQQLAEGFAPGVVAQVRIEQHIIWRVAPMPGPARGSLTALAPTQIVAPRLVERKMGDCVPMAWIAGGQPQGMSRLLLFLRDRRMVAANLEKACSARDFYSGFYVDKPNADGRLCADRDRILARSGARCEISSFRLLVAAN